MSDDPTIQEHHGGGRWWAMRTGNEPLHARSPLKIRFGLIIWGLVWTVAGTVAFVMAGRPGWAAACAALAVVTLMDLAMVIRHIHQGPHYQPGKDIPPYEPDHGRNEALTRPRPSGPQGRARP